MQKVSLSKNGPKISRLAYGAWRLADDPKGCDPKRVHEKIETCLEVGITTFDHADIYGGYNCEGLFGKVLKEQPSLRGQMQIITKCGINVPCENRIWARIAHYDVTAKALNACVERSLSELETDYVDVLLIHRPDWLTSAEETAEALNQLVRSGKILHAGVSNYNVHQFALLNQFVEQPLVTNQVELSLLQMQAIYDGTLDQCQRLGILPMAWSPTAGGKLFDKSNPDTARVLKKMEELSPKYGEATPDQLALAWILALPSKPVVILGTNQIERIRSAASAETISLERQDWYGLWSAATGQSVP